MRQVEVIEGLTWTIPCGGGFTATAAQLQHRVPCWGYVFQEPGTPPTPDQALMASAGVTEVINILLNKISWTSMPLLGNGPGGSHRHWWSGCM